MSDKRAGVPLENKQAARLKKAITECIEAQQWIQSKNPPTSAKWQEASTELHRLVALYRANFPREQEAL